MYAFKNSFYIALAGGIFYLVSLVFIDNLGMDFRTTNTTFDWLFRAVMICFVSFAILHRKRLSGGYLSFKEGFTAGLSVGLLMVFLITFSMWLYTGAINPEYTATIESNYRDMQYNSMMKEYIYKTWKRDTITPGAIDTVNTSLDKYITTTKFYFTNQGQVWMYFFYSLVYSLVTSLTISMLNVRKKA